MRLKEQETREEEQALVAKIFLRNQKKIMVVSIQEGKVMVEVEEE